MILTRDDIKLEDQEAKAKLIELPDDRGGTNRIGVIDVPSFYAPVGSDAHNYISVDVAKLIKKLEQEKVAGIILDMRSNPGGSLEEAIRFTGLFIKKGPVVLARNTEGQVQVDSIAEFRRALFRAARRPRQPLQRVRRGNRRRRLAGLWPRARRRRHFHARQGHGAKSHAPRLVYLAGHAGRHERSRHPQNHHQQILPRSPALPRN